MKEPDCEQLTWFQEDFLASLSALPGSAEARRMTVISGLKCSESYENSSPLGSLVKMCLGSSIWHSTRCFLTWKRRDISRNRSLFQLAASMPRTEGTGSPFWPTPKASAVLGGCSGARKTLDKMMAAGLITEEERRSFQAGNCGKTNPQLIEWLMGYEQNFTNGMIPTPTATDHKGGCRTRFFAGGGYDGLLRSFLELTPRGKIGQMNPNWIEWLMGFPIGWTELEH